MTRPQPKQEIAEAYKHGIRNGLRPVEANDLALEVFRLQLLEKGDRE